MKRHPLLGRPREKLSPRVAASNPPAAAPLLGPSQPVLRRRRSLQRAGEQTGLPRPKLSNFKLPGLDNVDRLTDSTSAERASPFPATRILTLLPRTFFRAPSYRGQSRPTRGQQQGHSHAFRKGAPDRPGGDGVRRAQHQGTMRRTTASFSHSHLSNLTCRRWPISSR